MQIRYVSITRIAAPLTLAILLTTGCGNDGQNQQNVTESSPSIQPTRTSLLAGTWSGTIHAPSQPFQIVIEFRDERDWVSGTIDIPQQEAHGLPLTQVAVDGPDVRFGIPGLPGDPRFDGQLDGDQISGTFSQAGQRIAFDLARGTSRPLASDHAHDGRNAGRNASLLAGTWSGSVEVPGQPLRMTIHLRDTPRGLTGTIDIPQQNARGLPLSQFSVDGGRIRFSLPGAPGDPRFDGRLDGNRITGTFTQHGQTFPFTLTRNAPPLGQRP